MYFPAPGDTEETILRKRRARRIAREGLMVGISPLQRIKVDPEFKEQFLATIPEGDPLRAKVGATEKVLNAAPTQSQQEKLSFFEKVNAATTVSELDVLSNLPNLTSAHRNLILKKLEQF